MKYRKFVHIIVLVLGVFSMYLSYQYFVGANELPADGVSCRALCGLTMLSEEIFGPMVARYTAGIIWLVAGLFLCTVGVSGLNKKVN